MPTSVYDLNEFKALIDRLYEIVAAARDDRLDQYKAAGVELPGRITYEEIDLEDISDDLLTIQKTLHAGYHIRQLSYCKGSYFDRARSLAFAGICQFVKDHYNGSFWESYEEKIGLIQKNSIYNTIWEPAFRLEGVELIRTRNRREFVDSFVNETGIPKYLQESLLEFFGLFWLYFKEERNNVEDIIRLISDINDGQEALRQLSGKQRKSLERVCRSVSDIGSSFARRVVKLLKISDFLSKTSELVFLSKEDCFVLVEQRTGIDPRTIFRNTRRLEKFWGYVFERVTPSKLNAIVYRKYRDSLIEKPDQSSVKGDRFKCDMYGVYTIDDSRFICVPDISLSLEFLADLQSDSLAETSSGVIARTEDRTTVISEDGARKKIHFSEGLPFFIVKQGWIYDMGFLAFLPHLPKTNIVRLKGADAESRDSVIVSARRSFNPRLRIRWNWRRQRFSLFVRLGTVSLVIRSQKNTTCLLEANSRSKPLAKIELDANGGGKTKIKDLIVAKPCSREIAFQAFFKEGETKLLASLLIPRVMLFTRRGGRFIKPGLICDESFASTSGFILLISSIIQENDVSLRNLILESDREQILGDYRVISLKWEVTARPCSLTVSENYERFEWEFDKCLEFDLELKRVFWTKPRGVRIPYYATTAIEDFEIRVSPLPTEKEVEDVNLMVSDLGGPLFSIPLSKCFHEKHSNEEGKIAGLNLLKLLGPFIRGYERPTGLTFRLVFGSKESDARELVFLPKLLIEYRDLVVGMQPRMKILLAENGNWISGELKGTSNNDQLSESTIFIEEGTGLVSVEKEKFTGKIIDEDLGLRFDIEVDLCPVDCVLWNNAESYYAALSDITYADIDNWELLTIDPSFRGPFNFSEGLEIETRSDDEGVCRRHRIIKTEDLRADTLIVSMELGENIFDFIIKNEPSFEDVFVRPNTRRACILGNHVLAGGYLTKVVYRLFDESDQRLLKSNVFDCHPEAERREDFVISLPLVARNQDQSGEKFVILKRFLKRKDGPEEAFGDPIVVSTEDRLLEEDLEWAWQLACERKTSNINRFNGCESLVRAIKNSELSSHEWEALKIFVAKYLLRHRVRNLVASCQDVLKKDFKVDV